MRGSSSRANAVTPASASVLASMGAPSGFSSPTRTWPERSCASSLSPASGARTMTSTSAESSTSDRCAAIRAPDASYSASEKPDRTPAPASMTTSAPSATRDATTAGTRATRRSSLADSAPTPTIIYVATMRQQRVCGRPWPFVTQQRVGGCYLSLNHSAMLVTTSRASLIASAASLAGTSLSP